MTTADDRIYGADAEAWGVPDGAPRSLLPKSYDEWLTEGQVMRETPPATTDPLTRLADQIDSQAAISNRASQMHILESIAAQLRTERNRLHSWAGLMSLLDEHYPADIFTGESKDIGPQILALIREINQLRAQVKT